MKKNGDRTMNKNTFTAGLKERIMNTIRVCMASMVCIGVVGFLASSAEAAIVVTPDHIVSGTPVGTLVVIDVPTPTVFPNTGGGDSTWVGDPDVIATVADNGFQIVAGAGIQSEKYGDSNWEPDGTPFGESKNWAFYRYTIVHFNFNLADCGIDLPDGSVINAIYTTWDTRGDTAYYTYTEGAATDTASFSFGTAPADDLVLSWTDDIAFTRNGNFEQIFSGPITVEGGDGFILRQERRPNTAHLDAVILDVTLPKAGAPALAALSPADEASNIALNSDLVATFDEPITLTGSGSVTIRNLTLGSDITITLPDTQVTAAGTQVTINPTANLNTSTAYAVWISNNAVEDLGGEDFAGIGDDITWNFITTADGIPPTILSMIPADDSIDAAPCANLSVTFSEDVALGGSGSITIRNLTLASDDVISLPDTQVSVSGTDLTIDPALHLDGGTDYAVQISADAILDLNGNSFAGIADDVTWNFITADPPAGGYLVTPDHIVTNTYEVVGTLLAVDVPYVTVSPTYGGPDWPEDADDGFIAPLAASDGIRESNGTSRWEPDGTLLSEGLAYYTYGNGPAPGVIWKFGLPDGAVINAVYATWNTRGSDGITYQYTEGTASGSIVRQTGGAAPVGDLVLSWTDSAAGSHQGEIERIFTGPITVEGGDGFSLWGTDNVGNAAHIDAVILDVSGLVPDPPSGTVIFVK